MHQYTGKLAVLHQGAEHKQQSQDLAERLSVPFYEKIDKECPESFFLSWREGCL